MKALITDIQRFSLTDGDGIRTTVLFKGCNMHCAWCHNPETISPKSQLMFYETKCIGCRKCFEVCPNGAHKVKDGKHIIDRNLCTNCKKCAEECYADALVMCGKEMSIDDIMFEVIQDKAYYNTSNGGVTLSGGEVLCHVNFASELANACHKENINVAIETNLCFDFEYALPLLKKVDLIMCDLKIFDDKEHLKHTGVSNKKIIENIKKLDDLNIPFIVRTPLIPLVTDSCQNIKAIALYIKDLKNLKRYELLNFNPLGESKYKGLDLDNTFKNARPLKNDKLDTIHSLLKETGVEYKIV